MPERQSLRVAQLSLAILLTISIAGCDDFYNSYEYRSLFEPDAVLTALDDLESLEDLVAADGKGNFYFCTQNDPDLGHPAVYRVDPGGKKTRLGTEMYGSPDCMTASDSGELYFAWGDNLYKLNWMGNDSLVRSDLDGSITALTIDSAGNIIIGLGSLGIRLLAPDGTLSTVVTGLPSSIGGIAVDSEGNIYVTLPYEHRVLVRTSSGSVSTLAGSGSPGYGDGTGTSASFRTPKGIAVDSGGSIYVADSGNHCIRRISPGGGCQYLRWGRRSCRDDGWPSCCCVVQYAGGTRNR